MNKKELFQDSIIKSNNIITFQNQYANIPLTKILQQKKQSLEQQGQLTCNIISENLCFNQNLRKNNRLIPVQDNIKEAFNKPFLTPWGEEEQQQPFSKDRNRQIKSKKKIRIKSHNTNIQQNTYTSNTNTQSFSQRQNSSYQKIVSYKSNPKDMILEIRNEKVQKYFLQTTKDVKFYQNNKNFDNKIGIDQFDKNSLTMREINLNKIKQNQNDQSSDDFNIKNNNFNCDNQMKKINQNQRLLLSNLQMEQILKQSPQSSFMYKKLFSLWNKMQKNNLRPVFQAPQKVKIINFPLSNINNNTYSNNFQNNHQIAKQCQQKRMYTVIKSKRHTMDTIPKNKKSKVVKNFNNIDNSGHHKYIIVSGTQDRNRKNTIIREKIRSQLFHKDIGKNN